ncbi:MAG: hypothetical protein AAF708_17310 [Deinococcota bacterium]
MIWQNASLVKKLCWLMVLTFTLTACTSTSKDNVPIANEAIESSPYEVSEETLRLMAEQYEKDYAAMSDYRKALVDCGYLQWIGGTFRSKRSLGGMKQIPEDCPDYYDFYPEERP